MATLHPFRALRPRASDAARIAAVPYDVVSTDEARALADGNPLSFLRVSRAELELPAGTDPYSDAVYQRAAANFEALKKNALVVEDTMSDDLAYELTKVLFDRQADLAAIHPEAKKLNIQTAVAGSPAPFHPGAIRYYQERGVWKQ